MRSGVSVVVPEQRRGQYGRSGGSGAVGVPALDLLEASEQRWGRNPIAALHCDGSTASRHRRRLVAEALRAYERLRAVEAADTDPLTVFRRWPVCTLVALPAIGGVRAQGQPFDELLDDFVGGVSTCWIQGWREAWRRIPQHDLAALVPDVPGLQELLATAGLIGLAVGTPEVRLDLAAGLVVVALPRDAWSGWTIDAAGDARRATGKTCPVTRPVAEILCRDATESLYTLPVVDAADPLLIFGGDGALLPPDRHLPAGEVWMLHPGEPPAEAFDGDRRVLEIAPPPAGWQGWWLGRIGLGSAAAVRAVTPAVTGAWRQVRDCTAAAFDMDEPLSGLVDLSGHPVYPRAPRLALPAGDGGPWEIMIREDGGTGQWKRYPARAGDVVDVAELLPRPALGRFRVFARHPVHPTVSTAFTVATGVAVTSRLRVRMLSRGGLRPADVTIRTPERMWTERSTVRLTTGQTSKPVELSTADGAHAVFRVELPHAAIRRRVRGAGEDWVVKPPQFTLEELRAGAQLDVRLPQTVRAAYGAVPDLLAGDDADAPVQQLAGQRVAGLLCYNLSALTDTAQGVGDLVLWLDLPGEHRTQVATVLADRAAASTVDTGSSPVCAVLGDGWLYLRDSDGVGRRAVTVRAAYAPWVAPFRAELDGPRSGVHLPPPFRDGGPLIVTSVPDGVAVPAGWVDPATLPPSVKVFRVGDENQVPVLRDPLAQGLARYLAGRGPLPEVVDGRHLLWIVAARATVTLGPVLGPATAQECAAALLDAPEAALRALGMAGLSAGELVGPLIRSGLAAHSFRQVAEPGPVRALWATVPLAALLLTSPLLPYLAGSAAWDRAELEPEEESLLDELARRCDAAALAMLGGTDIEPPAWGQSLVGDVTNVLVPDGGEPRGELPSLAEHVPAVKEFATGSGHSALFDIAWARFAGEGGGCAARALASAMSLAFALLARIAAQGERPAADLERRIRHAWLGLVDYAPDRVAADISLAEFLVAGWQVRRD